MVDDVNDGFDDFLMSNRCNGKVGTFGTGYFGGTRQPGMFKSALTA